jgi:uncharacterized protein (DUF924 family)
MSTLTPAPADDLPLPALAVLEFWFGPRNTPAWGQERPEWFRKDDAYDEQIRSRFGALIDAALQAGSIEDWPTPWGVLARIILLDQFPRNVFRGSPRSFAGDPLALALARRLVSEGGDLALPPVPRGFAYLPFEHAEDLAMQDESVRLFGRLAASHPASIRSLEFAERHRAIIARFGRFPHRNAVVGRASTADETAFLQTQGSRF